MSVAGSGTARLTVRSPGSNQHFGFSIAASADGSTLVAGAPQAAVAGHQAQGAAYVFVRRPGGVATTVVLADPEGRAHEHFGSSVAISASGRAIVVGAPNAVVSRHQDAGVAYVFVRPPGGWARGARVKRPVAALVLGGVAAGDLLGKAVAVSGDGRTVIAGAYGTTVGGDPQRGAAYVFSAPAGGWPAAGHLVHPAAALTASDGGPSDFLGWSVAISRDGSTVVAGAPFSGRPVGGTGSAYVFERPGTRWSSATQTAELTASNGVPGDALGVSEAVSARGSTIVVGACCANVSRHRGQGAIYVFNRTARGWANGTQAGELTARDGAANDNLGSSVAISPTGALIAGGAIGAMVAGQAEEGAVYLFTRPADGWHIRSESAKLTAAGAVTQELVGSSLALLGKAGQIAVGAPNATISGVHGAGAVYLLRLPSPTRALDSP